MKEEIQIVHKTAVVVKDENGLPNYMTMYYIEPELVTKETEKLIPEIFLVNGNRVAAVLISQYANVMIKDIPTSLPYQHPQGNICYTKAARLCQKKGKGWHLFTNTEWVYLIEEAARLGHRISGNTNYGKNADNPEEKGWCYDDSICLTGLDPLAWSHDGTKDGVFGLCGNLWEWVAGLRLHRGVIEYIPDNTIAAIDVAQKDTAWIAARNEKEDEEGLPFGKSLYLDMQCGKVVLTDGQIEGSWGGAPIKNLQLAGSLKEVPEIIHKLGILPHDWKTENAGIWVDSELEEAVSVRGSSFNNNFNGGAAALCLNIPCSFSSSRVTFRSALYLEDWKLVTEILEGA